jgi:hypothetical protein
VKLNRVPSASGLDPIKEESKEEELKFGSNTLSENQ